MQWRRSSACDSASCVEVAYDDDNGVLMRNSDRPDVWLAFSRAEWTAFLAGVKQGDFDFPPDAG